MKMKLFLIASILYVPALWAVDGVSEINQASVEASGGFPFEITQSGSYKLTGNLRVDDADTTAIWVRTNYVTVDLNGFSILGPVECSSVGCSESGTGVWALFEPPQPNDTGVMQCTIDSLPFGYTGVEVRNGVISGMGGNGIGPIARGRVESVRVLSNGGHGIEAVGSVVTGCVVAGNGLEGIAVSNSLIERNVVSSDNNRTAIRAFSSAVIGNAVGAGDFSPDEGAVALAIIGGGYGTNNLGGGVVGNIEGRLGCNVVNNTTICLPQEPN